MKFNQTTNLVAKIQNKTNIKISEVVKISSNGRMFDVMIKEIA